MKSPRSSDVIEVSPTVPGFSSRQESEAAFRSGASTPGGSDYGEDDDDYDWSGEEDLVDQQAKFNEKMGQKVKTRKWGFKRVVTLLFSSLIGSTFLAGLLITPPLIVHFYWYKPHPTERRRYVDKNIQAWLFWAAANVVISWFLAMIIDVIPIFVRYFLAAAWGHVSEAFKSRLEMYASVKDTVKPAFYAASGLASWVIIFGHIYNLYSEDDDVVSSAPYTDRVYQVILFLFLVVLMICAQQMLSHYIAWNFHQVAYKERIEKVQSALRVIEKLRSYRPKHHKRSGTQTPGGAYMFGPQFSEKDHYRSLNNALLSVAPTTPSRLSYVSTSDLGHDTDLEDRDRTLVEKKRNRHSLFFKEPPSNGDRTTKESQALGNVNDGQDCRLEEIPLDPLPAPPKQTLARPGSPLRPHLQHRPASGHSRTATAISDTEATLVQAAKVLKKAVLHDARNIQGRQEDLSGLAWDINSTQEAKRLARTLFNRVRDRYRKYLISSDFYPAFPTQEEAEAAFRIFDKDDNGDLSRAEIKIKLVKTYQERRLLSRSLKDVGEALKTLDRILLVFAFIILGFISLSVFGVQVGDSLSSMYTIGIAASFIFKSSASSAFDAIMFLFVTHPYDTGDRVFIEQENMVVKRMGLFATVFSRSDGTETYYFNSQLFAKFITNVRRSDKTTEMLTLQVAWKTPLTKLDTLEKCLNDWLATEENRWYQPKTGVTLQHIVYQRYLELTIGIPHNGNWQDWGLRNARRTAFHAAVQFYCRQLGITGYEAPLPIVFHESEALSTSLSPELAQDSQPIADIPETPRRQAAAADDNEETEATGHTMKATLGFLPPPDVRSSYFAKARKSRRSRKDNLGAMNAEM
ncbi:hypothetical protein H1R20_g6858, partial [Candolleomyces eurysporus]